MSTVTAKIRILPNPDEAKALLSTTRAYTAACNDVSKYIDSTHVLNIPKLNAALYHKLREKYGLKSQMTQSVIRTVVAKYKTILENEHKWIRPEFKQPQYDLVWNRDYTLKKDRFSVNALNGRIKLGFFMNGLEQYFDGTWTFGSAKLVTKHGKWFLHISVSKDFPEVSDFEIRNVVGVDLGINFLATSYDSKGKSRFWSGRKVKHKRAQYKKVRRELQQRQTASARRRLKKIGHRENCWMSDVNHQVSKALVERNPEKTMFVLEDLTGIRNATEKVALKYRYEQVSWAFYDLRKKIEYKAEMYGSKVLLVPPQYTSQTCPKCGHVEKANRDKKNHRFCCKNCGYKSNDDRIGAMNLYHKGIEYLRTVAVR